MRLDFLVRYCLLLPFVVWEGAKEGGGGGGNQAWRCFVSVLQTEGGESRNRKSAGNEHFCILSFGDLEWFGEISGYPGRSVFGSLVKGDFAGRQVKEGIAQDFGCTATRRKKNQKKGEMAEGMCAASMRGAASTLLSSSRSMRGVVVQFHATKRLVNAEPFRTIVKAATESRRPGSSGTRYVGGKRVCP